VVSSLLLLIVIESVFVFQVQIHHYMIIVAGPKISITQAKTMIDRLKIF